MIPFRFRLQKVLDWRQMQLDIEEAKFKRQAAALADLDRARAELEAAGVKAEVQVRDWSPLAGRDLAALGSFRLYVKMKERDIAARRAECQQKLDAQQRVMLEARRRCRLLERLKERRFSEWDLAQNREIEQLATESFLAQWSRRRA
jgi:flagellar biosynthesis chaperone FliJ